MTGMGHGRPGSQDVADGVVTQHRSFVMRPAIRRPIAEKRQSCVYDRWAGSSTKKRSIKSTAFALEISIRGRRVAGGRADAVVISTRLVVSQQLQEASPARTDVLDRAAAGLSVVPAARACTQQDEGQKREYSHSLWLRNNLIPDELVAQGFRSGPDRQTRLKSPKFAAPVLTGGCIPDPHN